jgi:hypothetical protein
LLAYLTLFSDNKGGSVSPKYFAFIFPYDFVSECAILVACSGTKMPNDLSLLLNYSSFESFNCYIPHFYENCKFTNVGVVSFFNSLSGNIY